MNNPVLSTDGSGYWSTTAKQVTITDIKLEDIILELDENRYYGELKVFFDMNTWDTSRDGLIYTDRKFLKELRSFLKEHDLPYKDVEYSEQGMQGDDFVSLDVGNKFIRAWGTKFGVDIADISTDDCY